MYGVFAAVIFGIPCALLYSVREPYSLNWPQIVANYGLVLLKFVSLAPTPRICFANVARTSS
jgi:hypothetical protein